VPAVADVQHFLALAVLAQQLAGLLARSAHAHEGNVLLLSTILLLVVLVLLLSTILLFVLLLVLLLLVIIVLLAAAAAKVASRSVRWDGSAWTLLHRLGGEAHFVILLHHLGSLHRLDVVALTLLVSPLAEHLLLLLVVVVLLARVEVAVESLALPVLHLIILVVLAIVLLVVLIVLVIVLLVVLVIVLVVVLVAVLLLLVSLADVLALLLIEVVQLVLGALLFAPNT